MFILSVVLYFCCAREYYRAVVHVLARGPYEQRKHAAGCIKKMLAVLGGAQISVALIKEYTSFLQTQTVSREGFHSRVAESLSL